MTNTHEHPDCPACNYNATLERLINEACDADRKRVEAIRAAARAGRNLNTARNAVLDHIKKGDDPDIPKNARLTWGHWACPDSPTNKCIYNVDDDPAEDECLFCGQPSITERK